MNRFDRTLATDRAKPVAPTLAVALAIAVLGCGAQTTDQRPQAAGSPAPESQQPDAEEATEVQTDDALAPLIGSWTLVRLDGEPVPEAGKTPTMEIAGDGTAAGVAGVNRWRARVEITDGRISFGPMMLTRMAGPPEAMELEHTFVTRMGVTSGFLVEDDRLRIWTGDEEALVFERTE